jgi:hypothetical protein
MDYRQIALGFCLKPTFIDQLFFWNIRIVYKTSKGHCIGFEKTEKLTFLTPKIDSKPAKSYKRSSLSTLIGMSVSLA